MTEENVVDKDVAKKECKEPPLYKIVFFNDDFTPIDFVMEVLQRYFNHSEETASMLTYQIHKDGKGVVSSGLQKDVAETKATAVEELAHQNGHPLKTSVEE